MEMAVMLCKGCAM